MNLKTPNDMTPEEARAIIKANMKGVAKIVQDAIGILHPELAESEDERIRKEIVEFIEWSIDRHFMREDFHQAKRPLEWLAYLEKHKYDRMQPIYDSIDSFESALDKAWKAYNDSGARTVDGCEDDYVECAHAKGFREGYLFGLEKQKENPKSADSIPSDCVSDAKCKDKSPKHSDSDGTDIRDTPAYWKGWDDAMKQKEQKHPNGCFTCDEYKKGYEAGRLNGFTAGYNKAMKEIDQKEQKPADRFEEAREKYQVEWSEEDEKKIGRLCSVVNQLASYTDSLDVNGDYCAGDYAELDAWLKSLRPKHKVDDFTVEEFNAISRAIEILYGSHFAIVPPLKDILTKMAQYDKGTV